MSVIKSEWTSEDGRVRLLCANCLDVLGDIAPGSIDCIATDPPYSARTHAGHNSVVDGQSGEGSDGADRKQLGYAAWSEGAVAEFVAVAARACSGWLVCMTDSTLAPAWRNEMERAGRCTFVPLPWYVPGRSVRLSGDGPSSWTDWIVVSRTAKQLRWGTLPGGYTERGKKYHMGGKPVELMAAIVRDYSRAGQLVCDPCMGSASTGVAAIALGRRFLGIERDPDYFELAKRRIQRTLCEFPGYLTFTSEAAKLF